jgi:hypothetical protein
MAGSKLYNVKHGGKLFDGDMGRSSVIVIILVAIVVIIMIMFYIIYLLRYYNYSSKLLISKATPFGTSTRYAELGTNSDSHEFTYAFWIYFRKINIATADSNVFPFISRTKATTSTHLRSGSTVAGDWDPSMMITSIRGTNRFLVSVPTNEGSSFTDLAHLKPDNLPAYQNHAYVSAMIDYIPIQQWVHIAVVVRQTDFTVYMNGDVYAVKTPIDKISNMPSSATAPRHFAKQTGSLIVGGADLSSEGLINRVQVYNYGASQQDIINLYNKGPTSWSLLSWLRIGRMRLQMPITFDPIEEDKKAT